MNLLKTVHRLSKSLFQHLRVENTSFELSPRQHVKFINQIRAIAPIIDLFRNKTSVLKGSKDATDIDT